jgi:putative protease
VELLAPAGNLEKLQTVYAYGADAAYIGLGNFSLRAKADNFHDEDWREVARIKGDKKLYAALNIYFHNRDLRQLESDLDYLSQYPFDAFIISDIGALPLLRRRFPESEFHLSTQANCVNHEAARMYADMGFSRIIPGRELSLMEISEIKYALPELEIETFIHGAMCLAYSGRCFLSSWMADRSANKGDCSHSCRWNYQLLRRGDLALEESKRPGEYYPVLEGEGFTTIMSSKDICMIDHIDKLYDAGIDSVKIEGRMKSMYYAAMVTRAYRKEIDRVKAANADPSTTEAYRRELYKVSHREFTTGFYFDREEIQKPNAISYERSHTFLGVIRERLANGRWLVDVKNQIRPTDRLEYIGPDILYIEDEKFTLYDAQGDPLGQADHGKYCELESDADIKPGYFIRRETPG